MDRPLKRIHRVRLAVFCPRDFFLLHDNAPAHTAASVSQFLTPETVTTLYHPRTLQIYLRQTIFCSPSWKWKVKRTPLGGCCWDPRNRNWWIKKVQKEEFSAAFQKLYDRAKACIHAIGACFKFKKKKCVFLIGLRFKKKNKSVLKLLDRTVYLYGY